MEMKLLQVKKVMKEATDSRTTATLKFQTRRPWKTLRN